jgi:hypothetical protein
MKTQILQLEVHDDIISTRDKLGWGQTGRVVLAWPRRLRGAETPRVLTRRLDLLLLQRHCAGLGLQIALATQDPAVTAHARELKIPVFKSVKLAQSAHWRTRRRKESARELRVRLLGRARQEQHAALLAPRLNAPRALSRAAKPLHPALRWGLFALAILSLLALGAAILPGAQISLQPETIPQEIRFTLLASPEHTAANLTGEVPARVYDMIVEGRGSRPASGETLVPEKAATVRVRFTNLISETVSIPEGLVISTVPDTRVPSVMRFVTTEAGQVAGGVGKFTSLGVRAVTPGRIGNLPAQTLVAIEGPLGLKLSVTNLLPSGGGSDLITSAPDLGDYEAVYTELYETLRAAALEDLQESLAPGDMVVTPTLRLAETLVEEFTPPRPEGSEALHPASELRLSLRLKFEVLVVPGEELRGLSTRILDASQPAGYTSLPASLHIESAAQPQVEGAGTGAMTGPVSVRWPVRARRLLQVRVSQDQAALLVRGRSAPQAEGLLQARLPLDARPHVSITPAWWPRLPLLVTRISVKILEEGSE